MTTGPDHSTKIEDAEQVLRALRTWAVSPTWADLQMHTGLSAYRLSAALSRLLHRTKQVEAIPDYKHPYQTWRYKAATTIKPLSANVERLLAYMREHKNGTAFSRTYLREQLMALHEMWPAVVDEAIADAEIAGLVRPCHNTPSCDFYMLAEKPKQHNTHIDIVVEAIRKSGGTADREAIWGRSPGLTWGEVDAALKEAHLGRVIVRAWPFDKVRYFVAADELARKNTPPPTPLTSFQRRALIDALLRGHHSITDAIIAAGEAWWQTADPLIRDLVANGEVNLQWSPPNGDIPGKMHYFKRKEAA